MKHTEAESRDTEHYVEIGIIIRPWGVHGFMLVMPASEQSAARFRELQTCVLKRSDASLETVELDEVRRYKDKVLIKLRNINSPEEVIPLRKASLCVPARDIPSPDGEWAFFQHELMGISVETIRGDVIGTLKEIMETGANDVYIIETPSGDEVLIPAIRDVIVSVDLDAGLMTIDPMEGLLPE